MQEERFLMTRCNVETKVFVFFIRQHLHQLWASSSTSSCFSVIFAESFSNKTNLGLRAGKCTALYSATFFTYNHNYFSSDCQKKLWGNFLQKLLRKKLFCIFLHSLARQMNTIASKFVLNIEWNEMFFFVWKLLSEKEKILTQN